MIHEQVIKKIKMAGSNAESFELLSEIGVSDDVVNSLKTIQENIVGTADAKIINSSEPDFAKTVCSEALSGKVLIFM